MSTADLSFKAEWEFGLEMYVVNNVIEELTVKPRMQCAGFYFEDEVRVI